MGILEFIFRGAIKEKSSFSPIKVQTSRKMREVSLEEIETKKKEDELLKRIKNNIESAREKRQSYATEVSSILKLTKEGVLKLEEKICTNDNIHVKLVENDRKTGFYDQYTKGSFVVPI
ncbi:MAG: hypothetical protein Q4F80_00825 [bacterium]|nr:hypothetical protein [bacterium]